MPRISLSAVLTALCCVPLLLLAGCAGKGPFENSEPKAGDLLLPDGTAAGDRDLVLRSYGADYILIGEQHDTPLHHQVQARLLRALAGLRPTVGLEMVAVDQNSVLERFNRGELDVDGLSAALDWKNTWRFDFALYRPVFEALAEEKIPVHGLNVPQNVLDTLRRKGMNGLSAKERKLLPDPVIFPPQAQRDELAKVFRMHAAMRRTKQAPAGDEKTAFERFVLVQSIWDTGMADQAARLRKAHGKPVVILAGDGHVRGGAGIAARLQQLDPGARIVLVSPTSTLEKTRLGGADYYYYAPARGGRLGLSLEQENNAVLVRAVVPGSPAEKAGIKAGDRIISVAGKPVSALGDLHKAAAGREPGAPLGVKAERGGKEVEMKVVFEK